MIVTINDRKFILIVQKNEKIVQKQRNLFPLE